MAAIGQGIALAIERACSQEHKLDGKYVPKRCAFIRRERAEGPLWSWLRSPTHKSVPAYFPLLRTCCGQVRPL